MVLEQFLGHLEQMEQNAPALEQTGTKPPRSVLPNTVTGHAQIAISILQVKTSPKTSKIDRTRGTIPVLTCLTI